MKREMGRKGSYIINTQRKEERSRLRVQTGLEKCEDCKENGSGILKNSNVVQFSSPFDWAKKRGKQNSLTYPRRRGSCTSKGGEGMEGEP